VSIERETFPALVGRGDLFGFPAEAYWRDIGNPAAYLAATLDVLSGAITTDSPTGDVYLGDRAEVSPDAIVGPLAVIGAEARVAPSARVERSITGRACRVGANAVIRGSVLGDGVVVGEGAELTDVVVGDGAVIEAGVRIAGPISVATGERVSA
jgi:mannose-1-phosphate guanylyltransferase